VVKVRQAKPAGRAWRERFRLCRVAQAVSPVSREREAVFAAGW
jgi:hypothetical protein